MQDESSLEREIEIVDAIAGVMTILSITSLIASFFIDFTPAAHFILGFVMAVTAIVWAVSATLKSVYGMSAIESWFAMGVLFFNMTVQFALAAFRP